MGGFPGKKQEGYQPEEAKAHLQSDKACGKIAIS